MNNLPPNSDPKAKSRQEWLARFDWNVESIFRRILHLLEHVIAAVAIVVLLAGIGVEISRMFTQAHYFVEVEEVLTRLLTLVVGLEFVKMLVDITPANITEVLAVAITRHVILNHENPINNLICVACIAGLFAIRRFLVRRSELQEEMAEE